MYLKRLYFPKCTHQHFCHTLLFFLLSVMTPYTHSGVALKTNIHQQFHIYLCVIIKLVFAFISLQYVTFVPDRLSTHHSNLELFHSSYLRLLRRVRTSTNMLQDVFHAVMPHTHRQSFWSSVENIHLSCRVNNVHNVFVN